MTQLQAGAPRPYAKSIASWSFVDHHDQHGTITLWLAAGWYRRIVSPEGVIMLPVRGWALFWHRLLWGFQGLVDAR